ncbi:SDR family NAD(P)-dependent oxidoreductase [Streptomyces sp. NPDC048518]|uniref:SDR family NAD(P)-dependent oxidoreductase n=1 Tax=Streptomyces sp. NPDC048518 TaxID=3155029 RepID=UPI00340F8CE3
MASEEQLVDYLKRVAAELHDTRQRLREVEDRRQEPVAIVGMACRFPGGIETPEDLWNLVAASDDAIEPFPTDRGWDLEGIYHPDPDHPGTCYVREGGFLTGPDRFDSDFFGFSPREALASSPQLRLLLETSWEALERSGINPAALKGSSTGVYVGAATTGNQTQGDPGGKATEGYAGTAPSVLSGRLSFTLGLEGPAVTVETACSSSLVAMHLAANALRQGECELALAGGVTIMSTPEVFTGFSRQRGLAPDGRCKPFAAAADGTGWGEGAGLIVLERLSEARRNGHKVLAVLRGSAINQDGASNGFTAPNGPSQRRVIRQALSSAHLSTSEIDAVEAHGTGTRLGDPIEAEALIATYGKEREDDRPLWLGSVKSNIGHTQAAAGVAGVIKMVMALQRELLPATLNVDEPTPHVQWDGGGVRLLTEPVPWTRGERARRAGVSSFGISGTNAHVILEEAPEESGAPDEPESEESGQGDLGFSASGAVVPWVVSGRGTDALREQARRLSEFAVEGAYVSASEVGWSLATTRAVLEHRAVVVGRDREALTAGLGALASGEASADVVSGVAGDVGPGPVLVFPGQGSQWVGMGAQLLDESPVFAGRIGECERALSAYVDWSLTEVLRGDGAELSRVEVVQPVLWAVMVSLAAVWADCGVVPAAVVGHSQGEMAAACVAGALSLEDAARIVAVRSDALRQLQGHGDMASLGTGPEQAAELIGDRPGVCVAAVNGPSSTVISGPPEHVAAVVAEAEAQGLRARVIDVGYASHGPQIDELHDLLTERLADIQPTRTDTAFYSTVTAERLSDTTTLDTEYWVTNLRQQVRFVDTIEALLADGYRLFIEASPHPVLNLGMEETIERADVPATVVPTLRREHGDAAQLARAAAHAFTAGADIDWRRWFPADPTPHTVDLPTYAFQRRSYWLPVDGVGDVRSAGLRRLEHTLLPAALGLADGALVLTGRLAASGGSGWLADHTVAGTTLVPGAALVEWALQAADEAGCATVEELTLEAPLLLPHSGGLQVQVVVGAADGAGQGRREVRVYSRADVAADDAPDQDETWTCHATGTLSPETAGDAPDGGLDGLDGLYGLGGQWPPAGAEALEIGDLYERAAAAGYAYGPSFQGLRAVWRHGQDLLAEVELPEQAGAHDGFGIHPVLLDAALHPALLLDPTAPGDDVRAGAGELRLPFAWNGVTLWATGATTVRVRLTPYRDDEGAERYEGTETEGRAALRVTVADATGAPVLSADSLALRPADPELLRAAGTTAGGPNGLFTVEWTAVPVTAEAESGDDWVVLGPDAATPATEGLTRYPDLAALSAALDEGTQAVPTTVMADTATTSDTETVDARGREIAERTLRLVREWLTAPRFADARLVLLTHHAVAVPADGDRTGDEAGEVERPDAPTLDAPAAAVWGLIRSAQAEHPDRFVLLDVGQSTDRAAVARALATAEPQLAVRAGEPRAPRLRRATTAPAPVPGSDRDPDLNPDLSPHGRTALDPDGTVLIAGGTGMVGGLVAEHLVRAWSVRHLLLVSRQGLDAPEAPDLAERLTGLGAEVRIVAADLTDGRATAELVASVDAAHPLTGVIHAAGVLDDAVVTAQTPEQLAKVWAAKASVAANLDAATAGSPLGLFVMFSSAAGVLGNAGQSGYAAANAFVDALMARRRAAGLPGLSIAWGLWARGSAMTRHLDDADLARLRAGGVKPLLDEQGLALLDAARNAAAHTALVVAAGIDVRGLSGDDVPAMLRNLTGRTRRRAAADSTVDKAALETRLAGLDEAGRRALVSDVVRECVAAVLGHRSAADVRTEANFKDLGFDSLTAVQLRNRLSAASGLRLPATMAFDHPTPDALAAYLCTRLSGDTRAAAPTTRAALSSSTTTDDPIAIVAMACKYPGGVTSPEGLWDLVEAGVDTVGDFPTGRGWDLERLFHPDPDHPGTSYADQGAFLPDAGDFDAAFFGINPREALAMDPQQRLMLEASWEVFERAGIDPKTLKGSLTGTYVGVMYHDYAAGLAQDAQLEGYSMLAGSGSVVSGRVSYTLGLEGPAMTVDTACSSSLVSIHLAAQALRQGECDLALAGGVTVMATPEVFTGFSRQRGLAPDGRCKPFAAAADGTGWGEGVGVVLLERLSDARRSGRRVLAVVRGSAVNQDGASNGLTAPNGPSQERVIRQALASGGLSSVDVDVVEGHGTGTTLGDPIEAQALLATYGQGRVESRPLWLGSVKSNIGHTQAAAGVAGVIKMVMALRRGVVPASLHVDGPSPHVDWESGAVRLASESVGWPEVGRVRRAGVSSFGASGTNAHVILEQVPEERVPAVPEESVGVASPVGVGSVVPWVLSARSREALRAQASRLRDAVTADPAVAVRDVGWALLHSRSLFEQRAVVAGRDRSELLAGLGALASGEPAVGLTETRGDATPPSGDMVWLFSGQGSQLVGMGAGLYERFPVFADAFDEVCGLLDGELGFSGAGLKDVVFGGPGELLDHTLWAQAGLFALQVGLARLWESVGVRPDVVVGHSIGEIAAAYVAGVFGLEDACRVVGARARLMGALPEGGAMCAVQATPEELAPELEGCDVSVAAVNTPDSTVISGPAQEVAAISAVWADRGRKTKALSVSHAFHSVFMEPMLADFTDALRDVEFREPSIPLMSNVSGERAGAEITTPEYWARHVRKPVLFQPAIAQLAGSAGVFVELGPAPVLMTAAQHTLDDVAGQQGAEPVLVASLARERSEDRAFVDAMARLHVAGVDVDWSGFFPAGGASRVVDLPTYAFQRERFWLSGRGGRGGRDAAGLGLVAAGHPLLGAAVEFAGRGGCLLTGRLSRSGVSWLADHAVAGAVLVPGAALVEWALRAGDEVGCAGVEELMLQAPVVVPEASGLRVQVVVEEAGDDGRRRVQIYTRPDTDAVDGDDAWVCHATGTLTPEAPQVSAAGVTSAASEGLAGAWPVPGAVPVDLAGFYERVAEAGYAYGPAFQGLRAVWRDGQDLLAEVELPEAAGSHDGYGIHPALLDATLHPALLLEWPGEPQDDGKVWLPFTWNQVALWAAGAGTVRVRLSPGAHDDTEREVRVLVADGAGSHVLSVGSVTLRPAGIGQLRTERAREEGLFAVEWTPLPLPLPLPAQGAETEGGGEWVTLTAGAGPADVVRAGGEAPWAIVAPIETAPVETAPVETVPVAAASGEITSEGTSPRETAPGDGLPVAEKVLSLVQEFLAEPELVESRLLLVTRGAVAAAVAGEGDGGCHSDVDAAAAAVWGLVRSAQSEHPGRFVLLDLDLDVGGDLADLTAHGDELPQAALRQAVEDLDEPQLALRGSTLLIPRLVRAVGGVLATVPDTRAWRLDKGAAGTLESVAPVAYPELLEPLGPGQVRLDVHAAGINFRDVLVSLGMVPGQVGLGGEGAGVVTEVGSEVAHLSVGDHVMGVLHGSFGPMAVADTRMVAPVPQGWDMRQAAGMPVAYLTAWYGLVELAGLRARERVLIHAGTGGVGMAAVRIARHLGAEVFATASPAKHAVLDDMGVDAAHRASSRDLDFEETIRRATGGRGVDVVLNSLTGEFIDASLRLLGDGGRFLEMGKTDLRTPGQVATEYPGVTYTVYDLVTDAGPDRIEIMMRELGERFASGALAPLPVRSWPLDQAREAFRFMSQAKHTGKLVLEVPPALDPEGTVLVTGGTGALGQVVAEHLVREWGVRHLLLASRRGPDAPGAGELTARIRELGTEVTVVAADVGDAESVAELVGKTDPAHPLTGVVHAAGVLDDAVITAQTPEGLARVWAAKASAAAHLHEATRGMRLGLFAVFSSAAATLGSPGQANYAAANAYCDALMQHRRTRGLSGLSIGWGLWETPQPQTGSTPNSTEADATTPGTSAATIGTGMTGALTHTDVARMNRIGVKAITSEHGLSLLDAARRHGHPHLVAADLNTRILGGQSAATLPVLLRAFAGGRGSGRPTAATVRQDVDWAGKLAALTADEQHRTLLGLVRTHAAAVLGHSGTDAVRADAAFQDLGFDSLTAVELRNRLSAATGLRLPATFIFRHPTPSAIADELRTQLCPAGADPAAPLFGELDRLETAITGHAHDAATRDRLAARLQSLMWRLDDAATGAPGNGTRGPGEADDADTGNGDLESASDDELFELIDRELPS